MSNEIRRLGIISLHASPLARLGEGPNGGLNVYVREICRALSKLGVATDVFTRVPGAEPASVHQLAELSRVIEIPLGSENLDRRQLSTLIPSFTAAVAAWEGSGDYDLLWSHYWLSALTAEPLHRQFGSPWAHTGHTWGVVKNQQLAPGAQLEPELRLQAERQIVEEADLLLLSTRAEKQILSTSYGVDSARAEVVMPGVDLSIFHPPPHEAQAARESGHRLFVTVGRLERLKGVDLAIRAVAALGDQGPSVRLLVVGGEGGERGEVERLHNLVAELGVSRQVEFSGPLEHTRLAECYARATAYLMPSYTESFGLAGLEAQACGIPVIASRATGLAEVILDGVNGFLFESGDPVALARAMRRLLAEPELGQAMGQSAALMAQGFSWLSVAETLLGHFNDVVSARRPLRVGAL